MYCKWYFPLPACSCDDNKRIAKTQQTASFLADALSLQKYRVPGQSVGDFSAPTTLHGVQRAIKAYTPFIASTFSCSGKGLDYKTRRENMLVKSLMMFFFPQTAPMRRVESARWNIKFFFASSIKGRRTGGSVLAFRALRQSGGGGLAYVFGSCAL